MPRNAEPDGRVSRNVAPVDFGLFAPQAPIKFAQDGPLKSMVRRGDHATSRAAAVAVEPRLSELQAEIMAALRHHGAMTDEEIERLSCFSMYAPSTVRKRRTDLYKMGRVRALKEKRMNALGTALMTVWTVAE
jgi:hypothetical protein